MASPKFVADFAAACAALFALSVTICADSFTVSVTAPHNDESPHPPPAAAAAGAGASRSSSCAAAAPPVNRESASAAPGGGDAEAGEVGTAPVAAAAVAAAGVAAVGTVVGTVAAASTGAAAEARVLNVGAGDGCTVPGVWRRVEGEGAVRERACACAERVKAKAPPLQNKTAENTYMSIYRNVDGSKVSVKTCTVQVHVQVQVQVQVEVRFELFGGTSRRVCVVMV